MPITITSNSEGIQRMLGSGPGLPPALPNHPAQSTAPVDCWKALLFGLPFLFAGAFIECAAFGVIPAHGSKHAPTWVIAASGSLFFCAGLFLFIHGVIGIFRKAAYRREASQYPGQPWYFDFHWRKEGYTFSAFREMVNRLVAAVVWNAILAPFFWVGITQRGAWLFLVVASLFALIGLFFWARWAQMLVEIFRYGNSLLAYDEFPYFLGGTLRARLRVPHHIGRIDELSLTLRCVREKYVTTGMGNNRSTQVVCYELYKDAVVLPRERLASYAGGDIPIEFRIPVDQHATTLADTPPTYWEIEARGKAPGADYEAYFLVPVYKQS
jgi:hypothetical protein